MSKKHKKSHDSRTNCASQNAANLTNDSQKEAQKEAVVLLNMGGVNSIFEIETFLRNMFSDPLILRIKNRVLMRFVANCIINARKEKVRENYQKIGGKSQLIERTFALTQKLRERDNSRFYTYAMRYTPPYARDVVAELKAQNIAKITLFSMYPQFSTTTTLSSVRDFLSAINAESHAWQPKIDIVESYPDDEIYIESCVKNILEVRRNFDEGEDFSDFTLLLSTHSLPKSVIKAGDIYESEVQKSTNALKSALNRHNIAFKNIIVCFQSKIRPMKWLEPSVRDVIRSLKGEKIIIFPLSFTIDNYETDFELEIDNRALASKVGVKKYLVCKCQNLGFADVVLSLILRRKKDINEAHI